MTRLYRRPFAAITGYQCPSRNRILQRLLGQSSNSIVNRAKSSAEHER